MSMHDAPEDALGNIYFPAEYFLGYNASKGTFIKDAVKEGLKSKVVILSHFNLLLVAWLIKKINPSVKIILIAHGIEVWNKLSFRQTKMLHCCDRVISVSSFTKNKIMQLHNLPEAKCEVLNNCIDPFLAKLENKIRSEVLMKRYGIAENDTVLLTLTRLSLKDRYKGYSFVLKALSEIVKTKKNIKYILAGSYEASEKIFVEKLIAKYQLKENVVITGFIAEEELHAHFSLADIYVMPSIKEGFGIVFVEAMYYGVPVIAANADGSTDALLHGKLGLLTNPESDTEIITAINKMLNNYTEHLPNQNLLMENFGYTAYKNKLEKLLNF
jgi:phosphatidyl-myo-inositol dimannoside synthase